MPQRFALSFCTWFQGTVFLRHWCDLGLTVLGHDIKLASWRNNSIILCTTKRPLALKPVPKLCCFEHIYQFVFCNHDVSQGCRAPTGQVQAVVLHLATESAVTRVVGRKGSLQIRFRKGKQMARKEQSKHAKCEISNCFDSVSRF